MIKFDFNNKNVLITGATSGIGRVLVEALDQSGARVIGIGRNAEKINQLNNIIENKKSKIIEFDLNDFDNYQKLFEKINSFCHLDYMVHSAGIVGVKPLRFIKLSDINNVFSVNLIAPILLSKFFRKSVLSGNGGSIVFISSVLGLVGESAQSIYCASKGGLINLTKSLAVELADEKIRVNCVAPALVRTEMYEETKKRLTHDQINKIENMSILGLGDPFDVVNAAMFLLSDEAKWVTGSVFNVDGGYLAR